MGVPWGLSSLRIQYCHCCVTDSIPAPGTSTCCRHSQKKWYHYSFNLHVSYGTMVFFNYTIFFRRRNCKGNPNCLVGIGEHIWLGEIDENSFHNIDDPNCERRKKVSHHFFFFFFKPSFLRRFLHSILLCFVLCLWSEIIPDFR